jgi:hypothetical protein
VAGRRRGFGLTVSDSVSDDSMTRDATGAAERDGRGTRKGRRLGAGGCEVVDDAFVYQRDGSGS